MTKIAATIYVHAETYSFIRTDVADYQMETRKILKVEKRSRVKLSERQTENRKMRNPNGNIMKATSASTLTISGTFNPLFKVLFTFPSWYLFAIGIEFIFSLGWNLPPVCARFLKNATLLKFIRTGRTADGERDSHPS